MLNRKVFVETLIARLLLGMLLLMGVLSYNNMVREHAPDLEIPSAIVTTFWPGAAPEQIEKEITKYLEEEIASLNGLNAFSSGSYNSYSIVAVEFDADMPVAEAIPSLRAAVDKAAAMFPVGQGIEKSDIEEMSVSNMPIISFALSGDVDDMLLSDTAKQLESGIENLPLVKKVEISGMREKSLHIRLKPALLRDLGISPLQVRRRIQESNIDMAWGEFEADENTFSLYMAGRFESVAQIEQLPIQRIDNNRTVRLGEIANVSLMLDRERSRTFFSIGGAPFQRGVTLDVLKRPGADTFAVIDSTLNLIDQFTSQDWPQGLSVNIVSDDAELIEQAFDEISLSMQQAVVIVFFVLMVLLSWREALIAGLALPVTMLGVLAIMAALGYTFNSMIMIGMVLALGLMVDVFILVMEGMHENLYQRKLPFAKAALKTVSQYFLPATAGQLTTILAMLPLMMIGGTDGKFIRILPLTITVTLLLGLVVAFVIAIPLSSYILGGANTQPKALPIDVLSNHCRKALSDWLERYVVRRRRYAAAWITGALLVFISSIGLASLMPSQMYAPSDDRKIGISIELAPDATLTQSQQVADKAGEFLLQQTWIEKMIAYVGAKSPMATADLNDALIPNEAWNQVGFSLTLLPKDERKNLSFEYLPLLREGLDAALIDEPGITVKLVHLGGSPDTSPPVQIDLIGDDYAQLIQMAAEVKRALSAIPGATDIADNLGPALYEVRYNIRHEALSFHNIDETDLAQQIRVAMEEDEIGYFKVAGIEDDPKIRLGIDWPSRQSELGGPRHVAELNLLQIISPEGNAVPLNELIDAQIVEVPRVFVHRNGKRTVTVSANTESITAGEVVMAMQPVMDQIASGWGDGYRYEFGGEVSNSNDSFGQMGIAFMLAMFSIYVLLTLMFGSFIQPLIIIMIVPLALIGTLLGFFLTELPMSFFGIMGIVSLAGIAVNNGIVLVDTINRRRSNGEDIVQAAARGAADRLRPILSTSLTTVLSLLPLAYSSEQWYPLCVAIIYGLIASTVIAMVIIPALYVLLSRDNEAIDLKITSTT